MPTRRTFDKAEFLPNDNSTPHIVPGVLYPAIAGKLLDGTTSHSGNYGTSQSDSRKYYYTDIKGSKPIRDPRIGAHFGSQRHIFKSLQFLEQETATHGTNVYSVDGREWIRAVGDIQIQNSTNGLVFNIDDTTTFFEITGYFNQYNWLEYLSQSGNARNRWILSVDGTVTTTETSNQVSVDSPLGGRYVDAFSSRNLNTGLTTPRIVTIKMTTNSAADNAWAAGCELIAQDTTNAVTRNKIQIPSQTVFSFGSKFTVGGSSAATHYDPFSAKSDGTGWTSPTSGTNNANSSAEWPSNIDTATSLGLAKWVDGTNYYRPYNGGRVVKWVDENGEIKTSVTVMPPNAKSIGDSGTLSNGTAKSNGSAPNDNFRPTFEAHTSSVDEDLLSEVAKTFHFREFGNGAANQGTGGTYADASMLNGTDDIAYVMDDGLTSLSGDDVEPKGVTDIGFAATTGDTIYLTFIGTGISVRNIVYSGGEQKIAQNLPYGTHVIKMQRDGNNTDYAIDGVAIADYASSPLTYGAFSEISFYQPKMPPIPEGACIIADYCLMADHVVRTSSGIENISKGVRYQACSRDVFYDGSGGLLLDTAYPSGLLVYNTSTSSALSRISAFSTNCIKITQSASTKFQNWYTNDTSHSSAVTTTKSGGTNGSFYYPTSPTNLGLNIFDQYGTTNNGNDAHHQGWEIVSPIHTSSHYQSFETPFLHELIGGDRNMEQTHLICSADGKTWDEVTRDTSYLGPRCSFTATRDGGHVSSGSYYIFDYFRGEDERVNYHNKGFAISYDKILFLEDGYYRVFLQLTSSSNGGAWRAKLRHTYGDHIQMNQDPDPNEPNSDTCTTIMHAKRGDWFWVNIEVGTVNGTTRIRSRITAEKLDY